MSYTEEILSLREQIHAHNHAYHVLGVATITDEEFDKLFARLKALEAEHPDLADENSPTARVGSRNQPGFQKVKHRRPMLSLDNAFSPEEVREFFLRNNKEIGLSTLLIAEPKIDGLACSLIYQDGRFERAVTRGDGTQGDDITVNARAVSSIPLILQAPWTGEVRGEIHMKRAVFQKLNEGLSEDEKFANPRNAAAGTMKQRDAQIVADRHLDFLAYDLDGKRESVAGSQDREGLRKAGFHVPKGVIVSLADNSPDYWNVAKVIEQFAAERNDFPYEIDGVVFKVDYLRHREELGEGRRAPKWAVAYKFPAERKETLLEAVTYSVGRMGTITPIAELAPVHLGGTTVKRASLMNFDEVARLGWPLAGDTVFVEKSAEIIPRVVGIAKRPDRAHGMRYVPTDCPCCHMPLVRTIVALRASSKGVEGVHWRCPNHKGCREQAVQRLKHAVSKEALDWDGFGEAQVLACIEAGLTTLSDLFQVEQNALGFLGKSAAKKFLSEREKAKSAPFWRKLRALGVESMGSTLSKELANRYDDIVAIASAPVAELEGVIGKVVAANLRQFLGEEADEIELLDTYGFKFEGKRIGGPLSGKTFVITGTMLSGTRNSVAARIEAAGGIVKNSVGRKIDFLVSGEGGGNAKAEAAAKHGTQVITEEALFGMLGEEMPSGTAADTFANLDDARD